MKIAKDLDSALKGLLFDGMTIAAGGFGLCGIPENLIKQVQKSGVRNLTIISNNCGLEDAGLGLLLENGQISKMISSYVGENKSFAQKYLSGELELELVPQGTLAERIRAAGAGIPAFYTKTGVGTIVAEGKEHKIFAGAEYILEHALPADLAIIKGHIADDFGNIIYNKTAQNFNSNMATAAKHVVCEVEKIVAAGELDANFIHTPAIYIDTLVIGPSYQKRIEKIVKREVTI